MEHLKRAIELSKTSLEAGNFPAGAVLISKSGKVYESAPSSLHNHAETTVIDMAIESGGSPFAEATIYASMQPCLMCLSKMYWAGVGTVYYVLSKKDVQAEHVYENAEDIDQIAATFFKPINMIHSPELRQEALDIYTAWADKNTTL